MCIKIDLASRSERFKQSAVSSQQSAVSLFDSKAPEVAWHRLRRCDLTNKLIRDTLIAPQVAWPKAKADTRHADTRHADTRHADS
ncbi:MAG: hypothetical protein F6K50_41990 [Moorea sp. SIO3I7]|nr:hypothetical protein [Moorena sp. SIO3I7]NEO65185.1 hypothetical protein [Moorena sp. SIO4G2]